MVLPSVVVILTLTIFPMIWSLYASFHNVNPVVGGLSFKWIGITNYVNVFISSRFWNNIKNLVYYTGVGVSVQTILGILIALFFYNCLRGVFRSAVLCLFLLPMMVAPIVAGDIWRFIFATQYGVANFLLSTLGLAPQYWLSYDLGVTSVMIADIWQWTSLPLLIVFAGRVSLPKSMYEAAKVDGASNWVIFSQITLPSLRNLIIIAFMLRCMDSYKFIDKLYIMTEGGPGTATELPTLFTYFEAFRSFNVGEATALTWVLAIGAILLFQCFWRVSKRV